MESPRRPHRTIRVPSVIRGGEGARRRRRHLERYRMVVEVLARHGLFYAADHLGLRRLLPAAARVRQGVFETSPPSGWEDRVPQVLADLGPTFVKLGQVASTRRDVLPPSLIVALESLQDRVAPIPFAEVQRLLRTAWGTDPAELMEVESEPLAAASIGQVHPAHLPGGQRVVVKVRRPGIVAESETDFEILRGLAEMAERRTEWARRYGLTVLVDEIIGTLRDEMDFQTEGHNTDQARLASQGDILVPDVFWEYTRPDVLVMSRLEGFKITSGSALARHGIDPDRVASRIVQAVYRQMFLDGLFHADPHPGNVHVSPEGVPIFLDWGMVGHLSPTMRERSTDLLLGMIERRPDRVVRALIRMGAVDRAIDREALTRDVERLRRRYYEATLAEFSLGQALTELFALAWRYQIRIPGEYALVAKTAVTLDGLVRRLNPDGSLLDYGRGLAGPLLWSRFGPRHLAGAAAESGIRWLQLVENLPDDVEETLRWLTRGELHIVLEHKNLSTMLSHWEKLANRIGLSFLVAGMVVGAALVTHPTHLDRLFGMPIGEIVFLTAVAMGVFVLVAALRRGLL